MRNTVQKRFTQTVTVAVALMVVLSVFGLIGTVAAQEVSVEQSETEVTAAPGETVELTTTVSITDLNAHGLQVFLPGEWEGTITDADGGAAKPASGSGNPLEVVWLTLEESHEVTYEVHVPEDADEGEYTVDVEGSGINPEDDSRVVDSTQTTITVEEPDQNEAPTASFTYSPDSPQAGQQVTFDASGSSDDSAVASYEWDFDGDGETDATGAQATHTFDAAGDYDVELTVTDDDGATDSATQTVSVGEAPPENQDPTASFTVDPASPEVGEDVSLDASNSDDPDGEIVSYEWDVDGEPLGDDGEQATTSFDAAGEYDVTLTVTDDDGATDSATQTVAVTDAPVDEPSGDVDVSLEPTEATTAIGDTSEFDIVVSGLDGEGVGAYDVTLVLSDGDVVTLEGVDIDGDVIDESLDLRDVTATGDTIRIEVAGLDTADSGEVVIGTVSLTGQTVGETDISVDNADVFDENGAPYEVASTTGASLTVEDLEPANFEVSDLQAPGQAAQGDDVTVTATVTNTGEQTATKTVSFEFDGETVDSEDVELEPGESTDVSFTLSTDGVAVGTYTHGVSTEDDSATAEITVGPPALDAFENPPQDLDGDGLYEDVNGDGAVNVGDVQALFAHRTTDAVQNNAAAFDFNGDGSVNVGDVQALFSAVTEGSL